LLAHAPAVSPRVASDATAASDSMLTELTIGPDQGAPSSASGPATMPRPSCGISSTRSRTRKPR
jgi:hypothetical protein